MGDLRKREIFGLNVGFSKGKRVIFASMGDLRRENACFLLKWGIFEEKMRDFRVTWRICEEKTSVFRLNWGFAKRKHVIFA